MTQPDKPRCETCRHSLFDYVDAGVFGLRCKRFPPTPVLFAESPVQMEHFQSVWPRVEDDEYCGEYTPKEPTP